MMVEKENLFAKVVTASRLLLLVSLLATQALVLMLCCPLVISFQGPIVVATPLRLAATLLFHARCHRKQPGN